VISEAKKIAGSDAHFRKADMDYGKRVAQGLGTEPGEIIA